MRETETEKWRRRGMVVVNGVLVPRNDVAAMHKKAVALALRPEAPERPISHQSAAESPLEAKFAMLYRDCGNGPELQREVCLVPGRKFRCDFYEPVSRTIIEIEGFRDHSSRKGFRRDGEKYLSLTLLGYSVIRLTSDVLTEENVKKIISFIRLRSLPEKRVKRSLKPE